MERPYRTIDDTELLENLAWVQALARRIVSDPSQAEDVAQNTCVAALERPPQATSGPGLRAWLSRVTRTMARESRRSEVQRRGRERSVSRAEAEPSAFDVVARAAIQQRIVEAVMDLDEPDRTTVLLRYLDGLTAQAIAEQRGESPAAVRQRLSRALQRLHGRLEREFGDGQTGGLRSLIPFAFAGESREIIPALGIIGGGALVTKTTLAIGIGVAVVVIGGLAWRLDDRDPVRPRSVEQEGAAVVGVDARSGARRGHSRR